LIKSATIEEAVNVWRWNSGGLGHSSTGYNGEYSTAITMDGSIVADFINVGTLKAIDLSACTIKGGTMNINDKFIVTDTGDATIAGKVTATSGTIGGCDIVEGVLKIKNANISEKLTAGNIDVSGVITAGGIAVKGDITAETTRATEAEGALSSRITSNAESITAEVTRATNAEGNLSSRITSNAESITAEVTRATNAEDSLSSKITQNANEITAKVSSTGGTASSFAWSLTTSGFTLTSNSSQVMKVTSSGLEVVGKITATSGSIGNLTITDTLYFGGNNSYYINPNYNDGSYYIYLPGLRIDDAAGAVFSGNVTASGGKIGNLSISDGGLVYGTVTNNVATGVKITTDSIWSKNGYFNSGAVGCWWYGSSGMSASYNNVAGYNGQDTAYLQPETLGYRLYGNSNQVTCRWQTIVDIINAASSDERVKNSIENLTNEYECFFDALTPRRYKYNEGTSGRYHTGYIAQEVIQALEQAGLATTDFAAVMLENADTEAECWKLRRDEFIALNTWQIQKLKARIAELEKQITA